jgi:hypothetical protein
MLLIAGFALGIVADRAHNRFNLCMERAAFYRAQAASHRRIADNAREQISKAGPNPKLRPATFFYKDENISLSSSANMMQRILERSDALADEYDEIRKRLERAAYLQFLPLPVDESEWRKDVASVGQVGALYGRMGSILRKPTGQRSPTTRPPGLSGEL